MRTKTVTDLESKQERQQLDGQQVKPASRKFVIISMKDYFDRQDLQMSK